MKITRFEDIEAWKVSRTLSDRVQSATGTSVFDRDRDLRSQMRRAASSVMANIAEGFNAGTDTEFARFLRISRRSATELQSHLYSAMDRKLLTAAKFDELYGSAEDVKNLIGGFVKYLTRTPRKGGHRSSDRGLRTED